MTNRIFTDYNVVDDANKIEQSFKTKVFEHTFGTGKYAKLVKTCLNVKRKYKEAKERRKHEYDCEW